MTQFMLCAVDPEAVVSTKVYFRKLEDREHWLQEIARTLFPGLDVRVPLTTDGVSISDVFTEAHNAVHNGRSIDDTRLKALLPDLVNTCESFVAWWGDDWRDLPLVDTEAMLVSALESQLAAPIGDVYLSWHRGLHDPRPTKAG